jgi:hypothetical protein
LYGNPRENSPVLKPDRAFGRCANSLQSAILFKISDLWSSSGLELIVPSYLHARFRIQIGECVMRALQTADPDMQPGPRTTPDPGAGVAATGCEECGELLHTLNNALASVLLNAQVMAWKLPSYSRGKRYLHEIERNAQRGGELVKRLLERSQAKCNMGRCTGRPGAEAAPVVGLDSEARGREREVATQPVEQRPRP